MVCGNGSRVGTLVQYGWTEVRGNPTGVGRSPRPRDLCLGLRNDLSWSESDAPVLPVPGPWTNDPRPGLDDILLPCRPG